MECLEKFVVFLELRLLHREPRGLDGVPGIDRATFRRLARRSVCVDDLAKRFLVVVEERGVHLLEARRNRLVVERRVAAELPHHDGRAGDDHRDVVRPHLARRIELRRQQLGVVVVHHDGLVQLLGFRLPLRVASRLVELDERHDGIVLGDDIAALADGPAVFGNVVVRAPVAVVEAVVLDELDALQGEVKPFLALLDFVVGAGEEKDEPSLLAYVLVGEQNLAVAAEVVVEAAVLHVGSVLLPPLDRLDEQPAVFFDVLGEFLSVHCPILSFAAYYPTNHYRTQTFLRIK